MTPTTDFAVEGILRQLQPSIMALLGTLFFIAVLVWLVRRSLAKAQAEGGSTVEEAASVRRNTNWVAWTGVILIVIGFVWNALGIVVANRIPRADLDGTAVYDQMQKNIQPKQ